MPRKVKVVAVENAEIPPSEAVEPPQEPEVVETPEPEVVSAPEPDVAQPEEVEKPEVVADEPLKDTKSKKKDEKVTCPICNQTMLSKTYKYTHQALCKPKEPTPSPVVKAPQPKPKKEPKPKNKEVPIVSFNDFKEAQAPDFATLHRAAVEQRKQVRIQRVKSLISQAI